jgi:magnesium chelatase family protein
MNLCPCGGRGDPAAVCACSQQHLDRYRARLSRALLDRFDLVLALPRPRGSELGAPPGEASTEVRRRVHAGREWRAGTRVPLSEQASGMLTRAVERLPLSGRGRAKVVLVAGTIAALAGSDEISTEHLAEALSYRAPGELSAP